MSETQIQLENVTRTYGEDEALVKNLASELAESVEQACSG